MKIAIIGAGLAGLTLASRLVEQHDVTVFEKARGPGGRMSTRRAEPFAFDHGAQYFTAETPEFRSFLDHASGYDVIARWPDAIDLRQGAKVSSKPKWIAQPGMNAICKWLAKDVEVRAQTHIARLIEHREGWQIESESGDILGPFDWVVSTAPSVQTAALMPERFAHQETLSQVEMQGCFALMLGFDTPLDLGWQAIKSDTDPIGWMAVNSDKPGRNSPSSVLVQSNNAWAQAHLEDSPEQIQATLLAAASELAGVDLASATHQSLHRWRYASTPKPAGKPYLIDTDLKLAACGDWCLGSKVEAAFLSALALAEQFQSMTKA